MEHASNQESRIRGLVETFVQGWNNVDPDLLATAFAEDADFTAINGLRARGRQLIARGHQEILATIFRNSTLAASVEDIYFLRDDVAVANVTFKLRRKENGSAFFGVTETSAGVVATRNGEQWTIAVFRNMVPFARPVAGPVEKEIRTGTAA